MEKSPHLIHRLYGRIFKIWRVKRFRLFIQKISPNRVHRVLDIGGYPATWTVHSPIVASIDSLNIHPVEWDTSQAPDHQINTLIGNGCDLEFPDQSYDIAFSNSVIEHVGPWENQKAFASEARRVAKGLWVQTPARECPIEPHYLAPFVHWLPKELQRRILRFGSIWGWVARPISARN